MYPVPAGDAAVFMPAAINLKAGRGLTNSLWEVHPDPTGQHRYLEHPLLFQMVVSACMWKSETRNAFIVLAIFNALTLTLYAAFLCTAKFTRKLIASAAGFVVLVSSMFSLAFLIFIDAGGRPEALSTLILSLAIAVVIWLPQKCWPVCLGIAIGVAAAIHPTHGIFIACLVVMVFLLTATVPQAIRRMMLAAAIALPLFWILLSLSPYPVEETLHAVSRHAALANAPDYRLSLAAFYLKLAPWSGLYLLGLSLVLVWCGICFWRSAEDRMTRSARLAALLLTASAFWFFSIRRPNASYYLMMLAPALAAGALYLFDLRSGTHDRRLAALPLWILAAFFSIFSLCLARDIALFIDYRTDGVSFADAQKDFDHLVRSTDQVISVSESLWVLAGEFERIRIVERGTASGDLMVLQQTQRGSLSPPVIPGYRLLSQRFISHPPKWFGWPIARTMPGYSFAVFAREVSLGENRPRTFGEFLHTDSIVISGITKMRHQFLPAVDRLRLCQNHGS
ncbi:MAG TPA: hypothetical protein VF345_01415 [Chthoniobacterales bacterium]